MRGLEIVGSRGLSSRDETGITATLRSSLKSSMVVRSGFVLPVSSGVIVSTRGFSLTHSAFTSLLLRIRISAPACSFSTVKLLATSGSSGTRTNVCGGYLCTVSTTTVPPTRERGSKTARSGRNAPAVALR